MDATRCPDPDALLVLLYDDEGEPVERATLQAHVAACRECADLLTSLDSTRGVLGAWHAPRLPLGFAVVRQPVHARTWLWRSGMAAAAVLVLAAASSLARLEIRYDTQGFSVRTGVIQPRPTAAAATSATAAPSPLVAQTLSPETGWVERAAASNAAWRADLDLLENRLRTEFTRALEARPTAPGPTVVRAMAAAATAPDRRLSDEELLRRVQDLLDQSEVRQQQNLAIRITEVGRQFQIQRQSDIDQMEQTLTRIEQQRNEVLRRVASTQPRP